MIADGDFALHACYNGVVSNERIPENRFRDLRVRPDNRITDLGAIDHRAGADRNVGPDLRFPERDVVFDVDRIDDRRVAGIFGAPCAPALEHRLVRFEHRLDLAGVVPPLDVDHFDLRPLLDHVLERVGQKILALILGLFEYPVYALEQELPVPDVVKANVRSLRDRRLRLLDDLRHVAILVGDDDAESLVVLDLLHPDDSIGVDAFHLAQIGVEYRVHENDEHGLVDVVSCERNGAGSAVLNLLLDEHRWHIHLRARVLLDFFLQMAGDVDDLLDVAKFFQLVEDVRHHRLPRDLQHWLGGDVRMRA